MTGSLQLYDTAPILTILIHLARVLRSAQRIGVDRLWRYVTQAVKR